MSAQTVTLTKYIPEGMPGPEHFEIVDTPAPVEADMADGDIIVKCLCFSADPYLRSGCKSEAKGGAIPRPMSGFVSGKIVASKRSGWAAGELFGASLDFTSIQLITAAKMEKALIWKLDALLKEENISHGIGVLGMPGSTAYGGLIDVLRPDNRDEVMKDTAATVAAPEKVETLWVSGAAGAVGSLVGQVAKNVFGCTVVGSAGGPAKCELLKSKFGFDHAIDYKTAPTTEELAAKLKECAPKGIDMYFDNVGGTHFEAAMTTLAPHGRVAVCGGIAHYNEGERQPDRFFPTDLIYAFQRVEGFMCMPWLSGKKGSFHKDMATWMAQGKIVVEETFFEGAASWPMAFQSLFTGKNVGKVVVRL